MKDFDPAERLGPDDMATRREGEFLAAALRAQSQAAARDALAPATTPGICANCRAVCLPLAVYCDDECRADHEHRRRVLARQGRVA